MHIEEREREKEERREEHNSMLQVLELPKWYVLYIYIREVLPAA